MLRLHLPKDDLRYVRAMLLIMALLLATAIAMSGCILWQPVIVVPHPDAPALITEVRRRYYRTAIYEKASNSLIDAGWIRIAKESLVGLTVSRFDWEAHIVKRGRNASDDE